MLDVVRNVQYLAASSRTVVLLSCLWSSQNKQMPRCGADLNQCLRATFRRNQNRPLFHVHSPLSIHASPSPYALPAAFGRQLIMSPHRKMQHGRWRKVRLRNSLSNCGCAYNKIRRSSSENISAMPDSSAVDIDRFLSCPTSTYLNHHYLAVPQT